MAEDTLLPKDIVAQVSIDVKEDNRKTFGGLDDIERLALKIVSYLDVTPRVLLERLLQRSDPEKGQGVVESLLARKIVFPAEKLLLTPRRTKVGAICIFDSFEEFVTEQMYELDTRSVIPGLLLAEASDCQDELPFALLALRAKYDGLDDQQREQMKEIILAHRENPVALWVTSYFAEVDGDLLQLADYAYESTVPVDPETLANFGHVFSEHEDHAQAIVFLEKALEMEADRALWLHELAHCYEEMGNLESAVEHMEKAAGKAPKYLDCLGVLYSRLDREDQALECYQKAIEYKYDNAKAWNNMGVIFSRREDLDKGRECYETALGINPEFIWSLQNLAYMYCFKLIDPEKAREYCLRALSTEEDNDKIWAWLAHSYSETGKYREAIQALERAVELNPEDGRYYYHLGLYHNKLDEFDKMVFYYNRAIEKDPEYVESYVNRGAAYYNYRADYDAALKDFETAIAIRPSHVLAHVNLVNALFVLGEEKKALREYEVAFELDPSGEAFDADQLNNVAYNMIMKGLFDKAAEALEIGLEKDPNHSYLYATKGLLYFRQGDIDQGRELYEQAISMSPDDIDLQRKFHYEYGMALRRQGKFDEAIEELECALNIASDYVPDEQVEAEILKAERRDDSE